jgi:hypothetical protein
MICVSFYHIVYLELFSNSIDKSIPMIFSNKIHNFIPIIYVKAIQIETLTSVLCSDWIQVSRPCLQTWAISTGNQSRSKLYVKDIIISISSYLRASSSSFSTIMRNLGFLLQLAFCVLVYPSLLITYTRQVTYLIKNPGDIGSTFYKAIPQPVYWSMFIVATLAAIVASQALITTTFSIIKQSMALSCFPRAYFPPQG